MQFPTNSDSDVLIASTTEDGLQKNLKTCGKKLTVYTPVYSQEMTIPVHDNNGELLRVDIVDMFCVQAMQSGEQT